MILSSGSLLQFPADADPGKLVMAQVIEFLPLQWESLIELLVLGFGSLVI